MGPAVATEIVGTGLAQVEGLDLDPFDVEADLVSPLRDGNIEALQQKLTSYQANYASLLNSVEGGANSISVIEPAVTPWSPISPRVFETVALDRPPSDLAAARAAMTFDPPAPAAPAKGKPTTGKTPTPRKK